MLGMVINTKNVPSNLSGKIFDFKKEGGYLTIPGNGVENKWWLMPSQVSSEFSVIARVKPSLYAGNNRIQSDSGTFSNLYVNYDMAKVAGLSIKVTTQNETANSYNLKYAGTVDALKNTLWNSSWLEFNTGIGIATDVEAFKPVITKAQCPLTGGTCSGTVYTASSQASLNKVALPLPSVSQIRTRLLNLQAEEYKRFSYDKRGVYIKRPECKWSFRSTARTMLKNRINRAVSMTDIADIISDVYAGMSVEVWVEKFYYA